MQKIVDALYFAKQYLKIKDKFFDQNFEVLKFSEDRNWLGMFSLSSSTIYFNGYPSDNTIFHESVHFKQWEDGRLREYPKYCYLNGLERHFEYLQEPLEREAVTVSSLIEIYYKRFNKPKKQYIFD